MVRRVTDFLNSNFSFHVIYKVLGYQSGQILSLEGGRMGNDSVATVMDYGFRRRQFKNSLCYDRFRSFCIVLGSVKSYQERKCND